jgi:hypothetical protein
MSPAFPAPFIARSADSEKDQSILGGDALLAKTP